jgi:hypothetical protein
LKQIRWTAYEVTEAMFDFKHSQLELQATSNIEGKRNDALRQPASYSAVPDSPHNLLH